ncbi:MAG: FRG domain-containing protein [Phycisphaerales bacterium]
MRAPAMCDTLPGQREEMASNRTKTSWADFHKEHLPRLFQLPREERLAFWFRGHASTAWKLEPTIDRGRTVPFPDSDARENHVRALVDAFKRQAMHLEFPAGIPETPRQWELLARHHGLDSTVLDWTASPFVAAYFAFADVAREPADSVAIWCLKRSGLLAKPVAAQDVDFWDADTDYQFNLRAIEQQARFMRVGTVRPTLEQALADHLYCFELPSADRVNAMTQLEAMGITARSLFRDLDGAARAANHFVRGS